jgi:glyoxylase-like metal-dependent hydrolase (beta-lactamase superfamily II)
VLWDCISVLDDAGRERIAELGGIAAICISHPHFYGANVEIADAFGARILLPHADKEWIQRPSPRIELFDEQAEPVPGLTVARIGGHFDGAAVLHWPAGSGGRGALLTGDTITVVPDRRFVSFMWSYPNLIPLDEDTVQDIARRVERFAFDRIYGGWWGRIVVADGPAAIRRSADRYVARLHGERP